MTRRRRATGGLPASLILLVCCASAGCGGGGKREQTTPDKATAGGASQAVSDPGEPGSPGGMTGAASGGSTGSAGGASSMADHPQTDPAGPVVTMPNYDPDPAQARIQVDQHLQVARAALAASSPDADTALREARLALGIDAASVDAAAMVAFAYYHKKLYDTAELVLDDLFKREAAKQNPHVYYVYGLVYDRTKRPEQAVLSFKKTVELAPDHASALVNLGVHQLRNSQYAQALNVFERLVNQLGRIDAITLTSLGSSYRGRAADYPAGSPDHDSNVRKAEAAYKRALESHRNYGPAYYNLGLLYLDNDPFPGLPDTLLRLDTAKRYFDQYKDMPDLEMKLYDERMKDVAKAIKRAEKLLKKGKAGSTTPPGTPASLTPQGPKAPKGPKGDAKRGGKR